MEEVKEKFIINDEARRAIINAVTKMYVLVGSTMGPSGGTVIIPDNTSNGKYKITKDGVSVAKTVKSSNEYEQVIIDLIREVASNVVKIAGDGTTTSIVLANSFINNLITLQPQHFKEIDKALADVLSKLTESSIKLTDSEINKVALISANGDAKIADIITQAYNNSKVVHIKHSNKEEDSLELINGVHIPSQSFYNDIPSRRSVTIHNAKVIIMNKNLESAKDVDQIFKISAEKVSQPYVVICNHVSDVIVKHSLNTNSQNKTNVMFIKSPGFASQRTKLLSDLSAYVGDIKIVNETDTKLKPENISEPINTFEISRHDSRVSNPNADVKELVKYLNELLADAQDEHETDLIKQRLDRLEGISIIYVGGLSEAEISERYDRYDDAVRAVECALQEGVVEGGGLSLAKIARDKLVELEFNPNIKIQNPLVQFYVSLFSPVETIAVNGCKITLDDNLIEQGVFDPVKVTKTALEQSYNFVKLLLTTRSIILGNDKPFLQI